MKKEISTRQIILILIISLITLKVLYLPSILANDIGRDAFLYVLIMLILDFTCLFIFVYIINKNCNLTFYEILQTMFGTFFAKVILFLIMLFFLLKAFGLFQTNFSYLSENLYSSVKWYTFSIPILLAVLFVVNFGINSVARLGEVFAPIIIIGFFASLIIGVVKADYSNLLPFLENGFFSKIPNMFNFSFWFGDYLIFAIFFGNIKLDKKFNTKLFTIILIAILLVCFFIATSYALFSYNSVSHTNTISDVLQVLPSTSDIGSFDWLLILIWDIALFLLLTYSILGALYCFKNVFFNKYPVAVTIALLLLILIPSLLINFDINTGINFVKDLASYFCLFVEFVIPILMLIFSFKIKRRKNANE